MSGKHTDYAEFERFGQYFDDLLKTESFAFAFWIAISTVCVGVGVGLILTINRNQLSEFITHSVFSAGLWTGSFKLLKDVKARRKEIISLRLVRNRLARAHFLIATSATAFQANSTNLYSDASDRRSTSLWEPYCARSSSVTAGPMP